MELDAETGTADPPGETLYAFYDLEICTVTFDFFSFLLRAEMYRKARGFQRMVVVFVPGSNDGFRMLHLSGDVSRWRMRNIHVPGCWLLESVCGVSNCAERSQAAAIEDANRDAIFPEGYTTRIADSQQANDAMIDAFMFAGLVAAFVKGAEVPVLTPSDRAKMWVKDWLSARCAGRRPVVITLRESLYDPNRNSNLKAWVEFARSMDAEKFIPIIVRDTDAVFEPIPDLLKGLEICQEASLEIDIRVALYEAAFLNMLVNNGPLALCYLNPKIRYLVFKHFTAGQSEVAKATFSVYGIPLYRQTPLSTPVQRNAWSDDSVENLRTEFDAMSSTIEAAENEERDQALDVRSPMSVDEAFVSATAMHSVGRVDPAALIYEHLLKTNPDRADIQGMLGLARHHQGRDGDALELLEDALKLEGNREMNLVNLGIVHRSAGNGRKAIEAFEQALAIDPGMQETHENLAELYAEEEEWRKAVVSYGKVVELGTVEVSTLRAFGACLEKLGKNSEAYAVYRRAMTDARIRLEKQEEGLFINRPMLKTVYVDPHPHLVLPRIGRDADMRIV